MALLISFLLFALGASLASFFGLAAYRSRTSPAGEPVWHALSGRSRCEGCGRVLRVHELVPVLGWLMISGRCARCGHRVPAIYPLSEALAGGAAVAIFLLAR
jgi:prepilin signal peptidase PulO-like enzyme (type II secretory pathway)